MAERGEFNPGELRRLTLGSRKRMWVSMPPPLVELFDRWVAENGYQDRSAAIIDLMAGALEGSCRGTGTKPQG